MTVLLWIAAALLILIGLAGIILPALPGIILIFMGLLIAAWIDNFEKVGWVTLLFLGGLTILSMVLEQVASVYGVKRSGSSKEAIAGSVIGAVAGIFFGIPGIILGPFIGAVAGELIAHQDLLRAGKAGVSTWAGLLLGMAAKIAIAFTMIGIFIIVYIS
jgi:uncharacterized protein YqgC (DUF456 family)